MRILEVLWKRGRSESVDGQNDCMRELPEGENSRGALEERRSESVDGQNDCMRELPEGENSRGALEERRSESVDGQNDRMRELTEGENSGGALEEQRQNALDIAGIEEAEGEEIRSTTGETVSPGEDIVEERVEEDSLRSGEGQGEEMRRETSDFNRSSAEIEGREEYFVTEWGGGGGSNTMNEGENARAGETFHEVMTRIDSDSEQPPSSPTLFSRHLQIRNKRKMSKENLRNAETITREISSWKGWRYGKITYPRR